ncbi:hypothetical protein LTR56_004221 [Elasticomyces elasticus]|nr:hypothetical protein LTR56_004221 [Elasticomyces elasticus]
MAHVEHAQRKNEVAHQLYGPLQQWQTRILRLHPAEHANDVLSMDLLRAGLADDTHLALSMDEPLITFEARSYTWGKPDDGVEKSFQVVNMFKIYQKAQRVLVWLGEEGPHTGEALEHLRAHSMLNLQYCADRAESQSSELVPSPDEWVGLPTPELREAVVDLCFRPWSRRVWIRQEVFAARDVVVFCGEQSMTFVEFKSLLERIRAIHQVFGGSGNHSRTEEEWDQVMSAMSDLQTSTDVKLAELKMGRRSWNDPNRRPSSNRGTHGRIDDPRDYVYGLLNLTSCPTLSIGEPGDVEQLALRIDYSKTLSEVFQDVTRFMLNTDRSLMSLEAYDEYRSADRIDLPTWTVDWRQSARGGSWTRVGEYYAAKTWEWQQPNVEGTIAIHGNRIAVVDSKGIYHAGFEPAPVEWASAFSVSFEASSHITCGKDGSKYVLQWTQQPELTSYWLHIEALSETNGEEERDRAHSYGQLISLQAGDVLVYMDGMFNSLVYLRPVSKSHHHKLVCIVNLGAHLELLLGTPWFAWVRNGSYNTFRDSTSRTGSNEPLESGTTGFGVDRDLRDLLSAHPESLLRFVIC